jgi:hypothetical protein
MDVNFSTANIPIKKHIYIIEYRSKVSESLLLFFIFMLTAPLDISEVRVAQCFSFLWTYNVVYIIDYPFIFLRLYPLFYFDWWLRITPLASSTLSSYILTLALMVSEIKKMWKTAKGDQHPRLFPYWFRFVFSIFIEIFINCCISDVLRK